MHDKENLKQNFGQVRERLPWNGFSPAKSQVQHIYDEPVYGRAYPVTLLRQKRIYQINQHKLLKSSLRKDKLRNLGEGGLTLSRS